MQILEFVTPRNSPRVAGLVLYQELDHYFSVLAMKTGKITGVRGTGTMFFDYTITGIEDVNTPESQKIISDLQALLAKYNLELKLEMYEIENPVV